MILLLFLGFVLLGWALYEIIKDDYPKGTQAWHKPFDGSAAYERAQKEAAKKPIPKVDLPPVSKFLLTEELKELGEKTKSKSVEDIAEGEMDLPFEKIKLEKDEK